ncbi:MAG: hypothetical protein PHG08_04290, partial [Bacilli bacterium]|nr:hypothetical protein [Bacilli bacterium]
FECITRIALTHGTIKRLTKKLYKLIVQFLFLDFVALRGKTQQHTIIQRNIAILFESWERIWYNSKRCKKYVLTEYSATIVMIGMNIF